MPPPSIRLRGLAQIPPTCLQTRAPPLGFPAPSASDLVAFSARPRQLLITGLSGSRLRWPAACGLGWPVTICPSAVCLAYASCFAAGLVASACFSEIDMKHNSDRARVKATYWMLRSACRCSAVRAILLGISSGLRMNTRLRS